MATFLRAPKVVTTPADVERIVARLNDHFALNPGTVDTVHGIRNLVTLGEEYHKQVDAALHRLADKGIIEARAIGDGTVGIFGPLRRLP